jgi:hypothetical protein
VKGDGFLNWENRRFPDSVEAVLRAGATVNGIEIRQITIRSTNCFGGTAKFLTVKKTSVALVSDHGERRGLGNDVI